MTREPELGYEASLNCHRPLEYLPLVSIARASGLSDDSAIALAMIPTACTGLAPAEIRALYMALAPLAPPVVTFAVLPLDPLDPVLVAEDASACDTSAGSTVCS